ncbi:unnamed protein product [Lactuca saligna]|uniref:Uncharacterized protein n=1 Tax=Lactuca saligna TaxID=75948 RepID=A0AA35UZZ8_LACSI|nr:unnamed protein product [Lactuca saligna]
MAEEQNWQEASNHTPCANNCGFLGSPTTFNFCSKCYEDHCLKDQNMSQAKLAVEKSLSQQPETSFSSISSRATAPSSDPLVVVKTVPEVAVKSQPRNRCAKCNRRVGLTGFTCRCGITCCGTHRYPEQHGCTFDYKTMGREAIAKANPVIKAVKLQKI